MTADAPVAIADLDRNDPLRAFRDRFLPIGDPNVVAYLDGNSLVSALW